MVLIHTEALVHAGDELAQASGCYVEQRQSRRQRVDCPAWVDVLDGLTVLSCALSDFSETGARLTIQSPELLPNEFSLILSSDGSVRRHCRVIWRSDHQVGLRYLAAPNWNWSSTP